MEGNRGALPGEGRGEGTTEPAAGAGDERDPAGQFHQGLPCVMGRMTPVIAAEASLARNMSPSVMCSIST